MTGRLPRLVPASGARPAARHPAGPVVMTAAAVMAVATVCLLTACSGRPGHAAGPGSSATPGSAAPRPGGTAWLVTRSALSQLVTDSAVRTLLASARVYEILSPGQQLLAGISAEPVMTFSSVTGLDDAVRGDQIPAGTYGVLYDPEMWSFTPGAEQRDPVAAATQAAKIAHAHGLRLLVSPALNLTTVLDPASSKPRWQRFLDLRLAARLAQVADVVELQAQSLERDTATYTIFVRTAAAQARAAKPGVTVLAGLSTNPPGAPVSGQHLSDVIQATRSLVDGYWLNIPGPGPRCPTCNAPAPEVAQQALRAVT